MLVAVGINLYLPYLMRLVIDGLTEHSLDQAALVRLLATYLGLGVCRWCFPVCCAKFR